MGLGLGSGVGLGLGLGIGIQARVGGGGYQRGAIARMSSMWKKWYQPAAACDLGTRLPALQRASTHGGTWYRSRSRTALPCSSSDGRKRRARPFLRPTWCRVGAMVRVVVGVSVRAQGMRPTGCAWGECQGMG